MEIKAPREVRNYHETIFFGLSFRQFICSSIAVAIAVIAYFALKDTLGNEGVGWVCIFVALPIASLGFISYHGLTLEHFVWAYIKSEFLMPKELVFKSENQLYTAYQSYRQEQSKNNKTKGMGRPCQTPLEK